LKKMTLPPKKDLPLTDCGLPSTQYNATVRKLCSCKTSISLSDAAFPFPF